MITIFDYFNSTRGILLSIGYCSRSHKNHNVMIKLEQQSEYMKAPKSYLEIMKIGGK